jgi:hypothetical protein
MRKSGMLSHLEYDLELPEYNNWIIFELHEDIIKKSALGIIGVAFG